MPDRKASFTSGGVSGSYHIQIAELHDDQWSNKSMFISRFTAPVGLVFLHRKFNLIFLSVKILERAALMW